MGKYLTTFPVVILFTLYAVNSESLTTGLGEEIRSDSYLIAWIVSSCVNAICKFIWDIYMDWGVKTCYAQSLAIPGSHYIT